MNPLTVKDLTEPGLRHRASFNPDSPYSKLLGLLAEMMEAKKIKKSEAEILVHAARHGYWDKVLWALNAEYTTDYLKEKLGLSSIDANCTERKE